MEPPTSEHRGTNLPSAGVRLLKRPTTNGSGGESSLHAVSSRGLGESGMSSKIGAPIIRRVPARPNTAATHQRPRELDKTGSTGQTRSQVVTEPSAATATPHNRTEETLESLDLTSHQLWPSIGGAAGTESGCGQEAWPSISSKGWSSVVKSAPSGKTPPLRRGPATVRRATGNDSSEGEEEDEPQVNGRQKQTKRKKKKKAGDSQQTPQAKKLDHPPQLDIFEYAKKAPVRPILNKKDTIKPSKDAPASRNMLDSTAPATRRGKEREQPKAKKPTYIRKIIDKEKAVKKELRAKGLAIPPDLDVVTQESNQSDQGVVSADDASGEQPTTPTNQSPVTTHINQLPVTTPTNQSPVTTPSITDTTAYFTTHTPHLSHTHPALPTTATRHIHGRRFREYCSHMVTDEINTAVNLLLQDLVRFQDRVYQKDPSLLKRKRRYVCGLREVYKHLEVGKLKCVIIAPNLDHIQSTGGIDERVTAILSLCQQKKVQVVYAMSRRRLAVVLKKKFKIGCIGIFSYDGAESHYRKLLQLVEDATKLYERIAHPQPPSSPVQDDSSPLFDPLKSESDCDHSGAEEGPVPEPGNEIGTHKTSTDALWDKYLPRREREMSDSVHHTSRRSNDDVAAISTNHIAAVEDDVTSQRSEAGANVSDSTSHSTSIQESRNANLVTLHEHNDFATLSTDSYQRFQWNIEAAEFIPSQNMPWSSSSSPHLTV